jgi:hypothetical protein
MEADKLDIKYAQIDKLEKWIEVSVCTEVSLKHCIELEMDRHFSKCIGLKASKLQKPDKGFFYPRCLAATVILPALLPFKKTFNYTQRASLERKENWCAWRRFRNFANRYVLR